MFLGGSVFGCCEYVQCVIEGKDINPTGKEGYSFDSGEVSVLGVVTH